MANEQKLVMVKTAHVRTRDAQGRVVRDTAAEAAGWVPGTPHPDGHPVAPPGTPGMEIPGTPAQEGGTGG